KSHLIYQGRLENTCRLLRKHMGDHLTFERPNGGLAIWAAYRNGLTTYDVSVQAEKLGLKLNDGNGYFFQSDISRQHGFIRIGYCSLNETEMADAVQIWKQAVIRTTRNT
ncbi:MAG TPA: hypothetical protein VGD92_07710, partial [Sphingobacteriaceae bacterium]